MLTREWTVGDVAMVVNRDSASFGKRAMLCEDTETGRRGWSVEDTDGLSMSFAFREMRPLVVIDPEDREQVERFKKSIHFAGWCPDTATVQASLREFANPTPPKPDEPTGLGAVVEDADGSWWVRLNTVHWHSNSYPNNRHTWAEIAAVRVLSEGVAPC